MKKLTIEECKKIGGSGSCAWNDFKCWGQKVGYAWGKSDFTPAYKNPPTT